MAKGFSSRLLVCITVLGICVYSYLDLQNKVTDLRIRLPLLSKEVRRIQGENTRLQYEIDEFENPNRLMELARKSEYSHLKQPMMNDIIIVKQETLPNENLQSLAARGMMREEVELNHPKLKITFAVGAKP